MTLRHIKIRVEEGLLDRAHEAAWRRRTTISALVREGLTRYVKHGSTGQARLAKLDPGSGNKIIRFRIDNQLWSDVIETAIQEGEAVSAIVRRILQRVIELEKLE